MEGVYLIHIREFITTNKPIYKIGSKNNLLYLIKNIVSINKQTK
jgi:hypothetical protein